MSSAVRIHKYREMDMSDSLTLVGFPSVGMVGSIIGSHLVRSLDLELLGAMLSERLPPIAVVRDRIPRPPVRIYGGERVCEPAGLCSQIGVITSELPLPAPVVHATAKAILEWCRLNECRNIVTAEGINVTEAPDDETVYGVATSERMLELVTGHGVEPLENGMVGGLSGVLLYEGAIAGQEVLCLMGEISSETIPDARAAARIVEVLGHLLPELKLDAKPLLEEAQHIEDDLQQEIQQATPTTTPGQQPPPSPFMYG